jgi:hypothetical protein
MSASLSLTETQVLTALRSFLMLVLPTGTEVVRGLDNRVPEPSGVNFVVMTPVLRARLETNTTTFQDNYPVSAGLRTDLQPIKLTVQIDVHGPQAADNTQIITTLWRSEWATIQFAASGYDVVPLYTDEPKQLPYLNGEQQVEIRWVIDAVMQTNPVVTTTQDFAASLVAGVISVDAEYQP